MTGSAPLARATALHAAGVEANAQMRPLVALRHLGRALAVLDGQSTPEAERLRGRVLVTAALAESERGEVATGLALLERAEPLLPRAERGTLHGQRGILLRRTGHDDLALEAYDRALQLLDPTTQPEEVARVHLNRAVLHMAGAHPAAARADLGACLDLAHDHGLNRLAAKARHNLGILDHLAGDLPAALGTFREVAEAYEVEAPGMLPVLALDRARVLLSAGLVTEADRTLAAAVRRLGAQRVGQDLAEAHLERAAAALVARRPGPAAAHARRASGILARRGNPRWAARARLVALRADLARGGAAARSVPAAALALREELDLFGLGEQARMAGVLAARATLADGLGRPRADRRARPVVAEPSPRWRPARHATRVAVGRGGAGGRRRRLDGCPPPRGHGVSTTCTRPGPGWGHPSCAVVCRCTAATSAAWGWSGPSRTAAPPGCWRGASGPGPRRCSSPRRCRRTTHGWPPGSPSCVPSTWRSPHVVTRGRRSRTFPRGATTCTGGCASTPGRRAAWPPRRLVRGSARCGRRSAMPCCSPSFRSAGASARSWWTPGPPSWSTSGLSGRSSRRCAVCSPTSTPRSAAPCRPGWRMPWPPPPPATPPCSTACCSGRCSATSGTEPLVVVPTGMLFAVPWGVLPDHQGRSGHGRPVGHRLGGCPAGGGTGDAGRSGALLVAGPRLSHAVAEVEALAPGLPDPTVLTGAAATVESTLALLPRVDVAHLATHGHHVPDNALFSALELADGRLHGYEVQTLPRVPRLVVLSACDVGRHDVRPGDESLGVASAFLGAGAGSVVASVTRVADAGAPAVMASLHDELATGASPAEALASAGAGTGFVCFGAG